MHLSNKSSIAQQLKKNIHAQEQKYGKFLPKHNIRISKSQKLQILEALHIRNKRPKPNRTNFQTSGNLLECL